MNKTNKTFIDFSLIFILNTPPPDCPTEIVTVTEECPITIGTKNTF